MTIYRFIVRCRIASGYSVFRTIPASKNVRTEEESGIERTPRLKLPNPGSGKKPTSRRHRAPRRGSAGSPRRRAPEPFEGAGSPGTRPRTRSRRRRWRPGRDTGTDRDRQLSPSDRALESDGGPLPTTVAMATRSNGVGTPNRTPARAFRNAGNGATMASTSRGAYGRGRGPPCRYTSFYGTDS